ncbi:MFS transporter [Rufibacter immobilis]|uniref:MFS transporter n=1 Tax=Rufibacter immobilis TaxID=1348778 RepID=A0A3M9MQI5_9BACT|nr:MFS transporter [Rufibacter immobilis]RNI27802.1 MFS transporter [Rufibacter immobilis]
MDKHTLPTIVLAQFACTSLWFAGNAVLPNLITQFHLEASTLSHLTSSVQLGFILGTLVFAVFTISDRFSPSKVFLVCALLGAGCNLSLLGASGLATLLGSRFLTGFCLAGIYPVGMKIAADYHQRGLGKALGFLVGALVLGTAFPHLLKALTQGLPWRYVIWGTSGLAVLGGLSVFALVPDGPFRSRSTQPNFSAFFQIFRQKDFRAAAFGYFGHMWELYTFWALVPVLLALYAQQHPEAPVPVSLLSFSIIAVGALACVAGGYLSEKVGSARTAAVALAVSLGCCLVAPVIFQLPFPWFLGVLVVWGLAVVMDSPQFSTLVAQSAEGSVKGTALTIVNSIGFAITIVSIQFLQWVEAYAGAERRFLFLALGPLLGLWAMRRLLRKA